MLPPADRKPIARCDQLAAYLRRGDDRTAFYILRDAGLFVDRSCRDHIKPIRADLAAGELSSLGLNARAVVRELRDQDRGRMAHWKKVGLVPGSTVRVREVRRLDGVIVLDVGGRRMVTGSEALEGVLVEPAPAPPGVRQAAHRGGEDRP